MEKKIPMSAVPMSRKTVGAHLGLHLKNRAVKGYIPFHQQ